MMGLLAFVILLPIVVFVHELGHFVFARLSGVRVDAFSIGFGRALCKWRDGRGTEWRIGMFPLGGYVKMLGQNDLPETAEARAAALKKLSTRERAGHFEFKKRYQKAAVIAAGPVFNYIFGILVFFMLFAAVGRRDMPAFVKTVADGSPAAVAGLKGGDRLVEVAGRRVERMRDVSLMINSVPVGARVDIRVERGGSELVIPVVPARENGKSVIGITYGMHFAGYARPGLLGAAGGAISEAWEITADTARAIGGMLTGAGSSKDLGGIISIAQVSGDALANGLYSFMYLVAFISISLGLFNLLPVPVLDGGYLLIYLLEGLARRNLPERVKDKMFFAGFAFIILLVLFATYNDIAKLLR
ncbi:MAG: RIP metalloprotease [Rickettsiales bacterium]|jgi:regulator of sigma E protease|nr:RIP metalloprotease [Rickettsiales bacterium]